MLIFFTYEIDLSWPAIDQGPLPLGAKWQHPPQKQTSTSHLFDSLSLSALARRPNFRALVEGPGTFPPKHGPPPDVRFTHSSKARKFARTSSSASYLYETKFLPRLPKPRRLASMKQTSDSDTSLLSATLGWQQLVAATSKDVGSRGIISTRRS